MRWYGWIGVAMIASVFIGMTIVCWQGMVFALGIGALFGIAILLIDRAQQ